MRKGSNLPQTEGKTQVANRRIQNEGGLVSYRNGKHTLKKIIHLINVVMGVYHEPDSINTRAYVQI